MKIFIYVLIFIGYDTCLGQTNSSFTLSGSINADSGIVILLPVGNISDYPKTFNFSDFPLKNGRFQIKGKISYPFEVILGLKVDGQFTYLSGRFFIEPGTQTITCNVDSLRKIPEIQNATMLEYLREYLTAEYQSLDTIEDYHRRVNLKKKYLFEFAKAHPASYVALWEISHFLMDGYNRYLDSAFTFLTDGVKSSSTGMLVKKGISQLAQTDTGKIFPNIEVIDLAGKSSKIFDGNIKSKYVLVDFWFSHCGPCLSQFPNYHEIFEQYSGKGFTMIGISRDSSPGDIQAWKKVISRQSLRWLQYRASRKTIENLRISGYPYNFLLDSSGKIITSDLALRKYQIFYMQI